MSSVHSPNDPRIFNKQCKSLAKNGYDVVFIVPDSRDETIDGVRIVSIPAPKNRFERMTKTIWQVYKMASKERAAVYHFHDPELIFAGILLRMKGAKVIYDVHEDYITSILQKGYLPDGIRRFLAAGIQLFEKLARKLFFIVLAEKYYQERFPEGYKILNYPAFNIIESRTNGLQKKNLLYTGTISEDRGALNFAYLARRLDDINIFLIGRCTAELHEKIKRIAGPDNDRIRVRGIDEYIPHEEIIATYEKGSWLAGLALFPATPHYVKKELTKFFEYMAAGIPVLCSDFPVWKELIEDTGAGICVNPDDVNEISEAIDYLYHNPEARKKMSRAGQEAVKNTYNWEQESKKLLTFYHKIINNT